MFWKMKTFKAKPKILFASFAQTVRVVRVVAAALSSGVGDRVQHPREVGGRDTTLHMHPSKKKKEVWFEGEKGGSSKV